MNTLELSLIIVGVLLAVLVVAVIIGIYIYFKRRRWYLHEEGSSLLGDSRSTNTRVNNSSVKSTKVITKKRREKNTAQNEEISMAARMYIRATEFSDPRLLENIGWRKGKFFVQVDTKEKGKTLIMTISPVAADCEWFSTDNNKMAFSKFMLSMRNPFILPCVSAEYHKDRTVLVVLREYNKKGSLRDYIHNSKPKEIYQEKYTHTSGNPLPEQKIAKYGREILEGLDYLTSQNITFLQLHCGNVILDNSVCRITDYENDLIQLVPRNMKIFMTHHEKVLPIVISFGYILYEMAVGYEMDNIILDDLPSNINPKVKKILKSIFELEEGVEVPSIRSLLKNPFFAEVKLYSDWIPQQISMGNRTKQLLQNSAEKFQKSLTVQPMMKSTSSSNVPEKTTKKKIKESTENISSPSSVSSAPSLTSPSIPPPPPPPPSSSDQTGRSGLLKSIGRKEF